MGSIDFQCVYEHTKNLSLLYVEDDDVLRHSSVTLFEKFFEVVLVASNGKEALELYQQYHSDTGRYVDLVITDVLMPQMNGMELISALRKIRSEQIVIVLSGYNDSNRLMDLIQLGIDSFLVKPIEYQLMLELFYKLGQQIEDHKISQEYHEKLEEMNIKLNDAYLLIKKQKRELEEQLEQLESKHRKFIDNLVE